MGSITVPDHTLQRQKKPSVTHVSVNYDLPFRCHGNLSELLGKSGARQGTPWKGFWLERLPVTREAAGSSPVAPANTIHEKTGSKASPRVLRFSSSAQEGSHGITIGYPAWVNGLGLATGTDPARAAPLERPTA